MNRLETLRLRSDEHWLEGKNEMAVPRRTMAEMLNALEAAVQLDREMGNPVPCHVMRKKYRDDLRRALAPLLKEEPR